MAQPFQRIIRPFLLNSFTWMAMGICLFFSVVLIWVFNASILYSLFIIIISLILISFWFFLYANSVGDSIPSGDSAMDNEKWKSALVELDNCANIFKKPVLQCIRLINRISVEFNNEHYKYEIENLLRNLQELIFNHAKLYQRSLEFGNEKQQKHMQKILSKQIESVSNSLGALKSFSGNLTLMDVQSTFDSRINENLKSINEGLSEAIEEVENDFS